MRVLHVCVCTACVCAAACVCELFLARLLPAWMLAISMTDLARTVVISHFLTYPVDRSRVYRHRPTNSDQQVDVFAAQSSPVRKADDVICLGAFSSAQSDAAVIAHVMAYSRVAF